MLTHLDENNMPKMVDVAKKPKPSESQQLAGL